MTTATSYDVLHWQLADIDTKHPPETASYVVVWWEQIPLGHIWWHNNSENDLSAQLKKAILPTIEHYLASTINQTPSNLTKQIEEANFRQLGSLLKQGNPTPALKAKPVTIIICTRNRPAELQKCLTSLQASSKETTEIIVVDNAATDELTKNVVSDFAGVRYIVEERAGLDIARNTGVRNASNDIIAFTDDDVVIPENWVANISSAFDDPLTMAVTGIVLPMELNTEAQVIFEGDWGFNKGYQPRKFDHRYFLDHAEVGAPVWDIGAGANMAFRKQAFQLAGLFDERLDVGAAGCSGDSELWFRILAEGWNCLYFPHIYVFHKHRQSMDALKEQLFSYMKGHACALLVQHEKYPQTGNYKRLYQRMPKYYAKRLAKKLLKKNNTDLFLQTEIKGCIAGRDYYYTQANAKQPALDCFPTIPARHIPTGPQTLVSVVIPCYNHGKYLTEAITSVLQQTHLRWEIIVVDDGSNDNTSEICRNFHNKVNYVKVERVGLAAARNIGTAYASGDYLIFLDADDFLYPEAMEINLYFFNYYTDVMMVSGGHQRVNEQKDNLPTIKNKIQFNNNYVDLLMGNYIAMEGAVMYRRDRFPCFHFDTKLEACEDYDLNLDIARHYPVFGHDKVVAAYRIHNNNMSLNKTKMLESALAVLDKHKDRLITPEQQQAYEEGLSNWKKFYN